MEQLTFRTVYQMSTAVDDGDAPAPTLSFACIRTARLVACFRRSPASPGCGRPVRRGQLECAAEMPVCATCARPDWAVEAERLRKLAQEMMRAQNLPFCERMGDYVSMDPYLGLDCHNKRHLEDRM